MVEGKSQHKVKRRAKVIAEGAGRVTYSDPSAEFFFDAAVFRYLFRQLQALPRIVLPVR
jgi:hypothetical protein